VSEPAASGIYSGAEAASKTAISTLLQRKMSGSVAPKKNKGKEINEFGMRPERDTPEYAKAYKKSSSPKPDSQRKYGTSGQGDKSSRKKSPSRCVAS